MIFFFPERQCWSILTCRLQEVLMKCGWLNHWAFYWTRHQIPKKNETLGLNLTSAWPNSSSYPSAVPLFWIWEGDFALAEGAEGDRHDTPHSSLTWLPGWWNPWRSPGQTQKHRQDGGSVSWARLDGDGLRSTLEKEHIQINLWDFHPIFTSAPLVYFKAQCKDIFS